MHIKKKYLDLFHDNIASLKYKQNQNKTII